MLKEMSLIRDCLLRFIIDISIMGTDYSLKIYIFIYKYKRIISWLTLGCLLKNAALVFHTIYSIEIIFSNKLLTVPPTIDDLNLDRCSFYENIIWIIYKEI